MFAVHTINIASPVHASRIQLVVKVSRDTYSETASKFACFLQLKAIYLGDSFSFYISFFTPEDDKQVSH